MKTMKFLLVYTGVICFCICVVCIFGDVTIGKLNLFGLLAIFVSVPTAVILMKDLGWFGGKSE